MHQTCRGNVWEGLTRLLAGLLDLLSDRVELRLDVLESRSNGIVDRVRNVFLDEARHERQQELVRHVVGRVSDRYLERADVRLDAVDDEEGLRVGRGSLKDDRDSDALSADEDCKSTRCCERASSAGRDEKD